MEALIRKGTQSMDKGVIPKPITFSRSSYARAFLTEFIFQHAQCSPSDKKLYVDFVGMGAVYEKYCKECTGPCLKRDSFVKEWDLLLRKGVVDPETATQYDVQVRQTRAQGFKKCDRCTYLKMRLCGTCNTVKRAGIQRLLDSHIADVSSDRETLARIQRLCITRENHAGFFLDAADSAKFSIPTTR